MSFHFFKDRDRVFGAEIIADERGDVWGPSGEVIKKWDAPLKELPRTISELYAFCFKFMFDGMSKEEAEVMHEEVEAGIIPDRLYNYYVIDPARYEREELGMSFTLSELLNAYIFGIEIDEPYDPEYEDIGEVIH